MDNTNLQNLLNDPDMLAKVRTLAHRERAREVSALLSRAGRAIRRSWQRLNAPRGATPRTAHCG